MTVVLSPDFFLELGSSGFLNLTEMKPTCRVGDKLGGLLSSMLLLKSYVSPVFCLQLPDPG